MTLFVVVTRSKRDGKEYIEASREVEGYEEYADAKAHADWTREHVHEDFDVYVGRVVDVHAPVGEPRTLADLS